MTNQRVVDGRLHWFFQPALAPRILGFCLFATAFYLAYHFGMSFSRACASPFWFPDAVLLCALLSTQPRNWWIFILATLPIRLFSPVSQGIPMWFLLTTFAIDVVRGVAVAVLLRLSLKNPLRMETVRDFGMFCIFAGLLVPTVSAFMGAAAHHALGRDYWTAWEQWFMGDTLVQLVLTPAILYWLSGPRRELKFPPGKSWMEAGLLLAGLILTSWLAFSTSINAMGILETRYYFPVPLLFWAAIRFGMPGASSAVLIITLFSVNAAVHGRGPFYGLPASETASLLQHFLLFRAVPLYLVAILIQQKENAEHFLRESEQRFRNMADRAPVMIWMSDTEKLCDFFNQGWLEFTGRTMEQEWGDGWAEGVHPDDLRRCVEVYHSSFDARQPFEMEYRLRRHDGEYRWVLDRGIPRYAEAGEFVGYVGTAIDLTDRKRAEEARRDLVHASRLAVLGEFTAMIAHELNQPLSVILTNTNALEGMLKLPTTSTVEVQETLDDIRKADLRANEAIRRIRALVKKREIDVQPLDINEALSEVVRLSKGEASRRGVRIREAYCSEPAMVEGDAVHLQQVVLNLILNGLDAMEDTPRTERRLSISSACHGNRVEVSVRDSGHGIAPENLTRVFNSFFTTKQNGMGIGLSMARSIIQMHGGRVWAENNGVGEGSTFHFTIPGLARPPVQPAPRAESKGCLAETR